MPNIIGRQALVLGAGMGGLTAARALADHFERVLVLERDTLPEHRKTVRAFRRAGTCMSCWPAVSRHCASCSPASTVTSRQWAPSR